MKRILGSTLALFFTAILAAGLTPAVSNAAPTVVVSNGSRITPTLEFPGYGTMGAVGYDAQGNLVGITAGHLDDGAPGGPVYLENNKAAGAIGYFANTNHTLDYTVVVLDKEKVIPRSNGPAARIDGLANPSEPFLFQVACKDGQTTGVTCGAVIRKDATGYNSYAVAYSGDSGGPGWVRDTKLAGITLSILNPNPPGTTRWLSIFTILNNIPAGTPGKGFVPVNN